MASYAQSFDWACPACGDAGQRDVWLVVDGEDRPDLLRALAGDSLNRMPCRRCGAPVPPAGMASLLVRRPGRRPAMLFAAAPGAPPDRMREQLTVSVMMVSRGGSAAPGEVMVVPLALLPVMADRDVETDLAAVEDGSFRALSAELQRYSDWLRGLSEQRWKAATQGPLMELLDATEPADWRRIVEEHPPLLSDRMDQLLGHLAETAEQEGQPQMADVARHRRMLLQRCRRYGVDEVLPPDAAAAPPPVDEEPALRGAVGGALIAVSGLPVPGRDEPFSAEETRELLGAALLQISPEEAKLHLDHGHDELIGLADFFAIELATRLVEAPRDANDLREAVRLGERLGHLRDTAPVTWAQAQQNGAIARARLAPAGDIAALDEACAGFHRALTVLTASAHPRDWALVLVGLSNVLIQDYPSQVPAYLDEAIARLDEALADPPADLGEEARRSLRSTLGSALLRRAERANDDDALRRATAELEGLRAGSAGELHRVVRTNLGLAYSLRAERSGRRADWQRAVGVLREALDASAAADEQQWISAAGNLGIALRHSGEVDEAAALFRTVIGRCAAAELWQGWAGMQNNLGMALLDRVAGDRDENVAAAIDAFDKARTVWTRQGFPIDWALTTARLATAYEQTPGDARAGELLAEAAAALPRAAHPTAWAGVTNQLAGHLDAPAAIPRYRAAAEVLTREEFPHEWAAIQHNLGGAYRRLGRPEMAAACYRAALDVRPAGEAPIEWAQTATALSTALIAGNAPFGEVDALLTRALAAVRDGAPAVEVVRVAGRLGRLRAEHGRWEPAAEAFREAMAASDRIYASALLRSSRERTLGEHSWLFHAAAYVLVRLGRMDEAVATLESGRTRLLGEALARDPAGFDRVRLTHPRQYAEYTAAVRELARAEAAAIRLMAAARTGDDPYRFRAEQAVRAEIRRAVAAFEAARAAMPAAPAEDAGGGAPGSALVYLFATGRDITGIVAGPDGAEAVPLPGFDGRALGSIVHGDGDRPGLLRAQTDDRAAFGRMLDDCLATIGRTVVEELARVLRRRGATAVTLVPVGLFGAIPLHAAPYADDRCLVDEFTVSYAPSATVLGACRREAATRAGAARRGLAVIDPAARLPLAGYEASVLTSWTGGEPVVGAATDLDGRLGAATHVHFACHARSVLDEPLSSHLALGDGRRLSLLDLLTGGQESRLRRARLVVASACQTATVEAERIPDEYVGLAAGFLLAGVPCFVGTQWPAEDTPSALLMTRFYELLFAERRPADVALCTAQRWLRDLTGRELLTYVEARPALAAALTRQTRIATRYPDRRFFADAAVWSPYVLVGAATREEADDDGNAA